MAKPKPSPKQPELGLPEAGALPEGLRHYAKRDADGEILVWEAEAGHVLNVHLQHDAQGRLLLHLEAADEVPG